MQTDDVQKAIRTSGLDGWLFFDHHRRDPLAYRILNISTSVDPTRRWYCLIPAEGPVKKLVHQIEGRVLDNVEGVNYTYSSWSDQTERLREMLKGCSRIAMQYSPNCAIPYVSLVDAGTLELVRSCGVEVLSSADLVQQFEARWSEEQLKLHLEAGRRVDQIRRDAFDFIGERIRADASVTEYDVQQFILNRFGQSDLQTDHGPIVAVNQHASDPHYEPSLQSAVPIKAGDFVLIDLWAKLMESHAVYYDITWTGYCGEVIPSRIQNVFEIVRDARRKAIEFVIQSVAARRRFAGFEVDDVARNYIRQQGYGESFFHRTGHSIGSEVHGTGANIDNFESHDERQIISRTCFSIEPGIYLADFGVRSEVDVYVGEGFARVTGEEQEELVRICGG